MTILPPANALRAHEQFDEQSSIFQRAFRPKHLQAHENLISSRVSAQLPLVNLFAFGILESFLTVELKHVVEPKKTQSRGGSSSQLAFRENLFSSQQSDSTLVSEWSVTQCEDEDAKCDVMQLRNRFVGQQTTA